MATLTDWDDTQLGPRDTWSKCLTTYASILTQTEVPAAIFWGLDLTLISNDAWTRLDERRQWHGKSQEKRLCKPAVDALRGTIKSLPPKKVSAEELLGKSQPPEKETYTVLLSPIPDHATGMTKGVFAQLFNAPEPQSQVPEEGGAPESTEQDRTSAKAVAPQEEESHLTQPKRPRPSRDQLSDSTQPFLYRFAELLPAGLAILNKNAQALFVNQPFRDLTTQGEDDDAFNAWPKSIHLDDYDRVMNLYNDAFRLKRQLSCEFRARHNADFWRLLLVNAMSANDLQSLGLHDDNGFVCNIVDISAEKNAEHAERKAKTEAEERKEQQERFIDMISHEIRNPLSAVLHCAEDILELVGDKTTDKIDVDEISEAAETIALCVSHQKHIVDDVLSFSKIDASMLSLSPHPVKPRRDIAQSLRIFQVELRKENLEFGFEIDVSYDEANVVWVNADLTRIGQVLTNLISNAIKFTRPSQGERKITVSMGASRERPTSYPPSVVFFDPDDTAYRMDATVTSEWGNGESLYILIAVRDTGIGISQEGQMKLFQRFRQATPKTEEIYGGSGLGLSISRKLCHLHGGEIGVSSIEGKGSTFGFFFRVRQTAEPETKPKPELAELRDDVVKAEAEKLGHDASEEIDDQEVPDSLNNPPVTHVPEAASEANITQRTKETLEAASRADNAPSDLYAMGGRSESHSSEEVLNKIDRSPLPSRGPSFEDSRLLRNKDKNNDRDCLPIPYGSIEKTLSTPKTDIQSSNNAQKPPKHVLLVEDNIINQRILQRKLAHKGYTVNPANNGREAVDLFTASFTHSTSSLPSNHKSAPAPFDVILMDQEMPVLDGNGASREIRRLEQTSTLAENEEYKAWRQEKGRGVPILGVTANAREEQGMEMRKAGMDDVIHKPYKIESMIEKIEGLTSGVGREGKQEETQKAENQGGAEGS